MTPSESRPREIPVIISEEDTPVSPDPEHDTDKNLTDVESLDNQITTFKYITGRKVLYISMGVMVASTVFSVLLSFFDIENSMLQNLFEVFKLIAMTVLGYIFGSKTT